MNKTIAEFKGIAIYVDTMIFYQLLRENGSLAEVFFRGSQAKNIQLYTSVLTFDELAYRLLLALIRDKYSGSPLDQLRKNEQALIAEFSSKIEAALIQLQSLPNLSLIDYTVADVSIMHQNMRLFYLRPRDALHLATMQKTKCLEVVSHDSDFSSVPFIQRYTLS